MTFPTTPTRTKIKEELWLGDLGADALESTKATSRVEAIEFKMFIYNLYFKKLVETIENGGAAHCNKPINIKSFV